MSNIDLSIPGSTNPYYTPGSPGATANAVASGLAMLSSVDFDSLDTDASDGIQRTLQSLRYAAAMLSCDLDSPASQPEDREIEIIVSDDELAQLTAIAEKERLLRRLQDALDECHR